jgi:adenylate cyclase
VNSVTVNRYGGAVAPHRNPMRHPSEAIQEALLGGPHTLDAHDVARIAGISVELVMDFWRILSLPRVDADEPVFTQGDAEMVQLLADLIRSHGLSMETVVSIVRAVGHNGDRVAMWQMEALVEDLEENRDGRAARVELLRRLPGLVGPLGELVGYAYRRQLAAVAGRYTAEFVDQAEQYDGRALPLARAVGFADMVSFTRTTAGLDHAELTAFVRGFENRVRDVVTFNGGRIIKTVGDGVLFVADDAVTGALVAVHLAEAFTQHIRPKRARPAPPRDVSLRVSVVWGRLLAKYGDVFGPPVTLAARLCQSAGAGVVLTDADTADVLRGDPRFVLASQPVRELTGLGRLAPVRITQAHRGGS